MTTANIRHGVPKHLVNVDLKAYEAEVAATRKAMVAPFAVAPRCTVATRRGLLQPGAEVAIDDLDEVQGTDGYVIAAWRRFRDLVQAGIVLERL